MGRMGENGVIVEFAMVTPDGSRERGDPTEIDSDPIFMFSWR
jgi:hypothetical protein